MQDRFPGAVFKPLSASNTEPSIGVPRLLVWHTMQGFLKGTFDLFRKNGYTGTESTFGVGGPWDGEALDGTVWQFQHLGRQADAQAAGNAFATSIESSDGGNPTRPFSDAQLTAHVRLGVWWCEQTGVPPVRALEFNGRGFGYHRMFTQWNPHGHSCPGDARARQLETEVWPEIAHLLHHNGSGRGAHPHGQAVPPFPLTTGDFYGRNHNGGIPIAEPGLLAWQRQMVVRGAQRLVGHVNGQYTDATEAVCRAFQREQGLRVDGRIGLATWNAAFLAPLAATV